MILGLSWVFAVAGRQLCTAQRHVEEIYTGYAKHQTTCSVKEAFALGLAFPGCAVPCDAAAPEAG